MALLAAGCEERPRQVAASETVSEQSSEFAASGIERLIPIRFVMLLDSGTFAPATYVSRVNGAVARANLIFKPLGVQFYAAGIEAKQTAVLNANEANDNPIKWSSVYTNFQAIFPAATASSFNPDEIKTIRQWYQVAADRWADDSQIFVYLTSTGDGKGRFPFEGRDIEIYEGFLDNNALLAHEIGHFLGVGHPFLIADSDVIHPETGSTLKLADWWDMTYIQDGTTIKVPSNRDEAWAAQTAMPPKLFRMNNNFIVENVSNNDYCGTLGYGTGNDGLYRANCCPTATWSQFNTGLSSGAMSCSVGKDPYNNGSGYRQLITTGDARLAALSFTTGEADNPPYSRKYGFNVMDYLQGPHDFPSQFSQSQIKMMRAYLRFEVPLTGEAFVGMNRSSRRTRLGRGVSRRPAYSLDFDGDGKRDIALWLPPTSTTTTPAFKIYLSSSSPAYSSPFVISTPFAQAGDVPVPADYDGDGKTDIALYRPGGAGTNTSQWIYCPTAPVVVFTQCPQSPPVLLFGNQESVPLQDTSFFSVPEMATYTPSTGAWRWRKVSSTLTSSITLGQANSVLLPGLYDNDDTTDLAVYDPATATFSLKLSGDAWTATVTRSFPSGYIASLAGGTPADRSGAIPIPGMYKKRKVGTYSNGDGDWANRLALTLWDPQSGNWASMWDPVFSSTITTCPWGGPSDIPLSSLGTKANRLRLNPFSFPPDTYSKLAFFSPASSGSSYLSIKDQCAISNGTSSTINHGHTPFTYQIFSVADMDGDLLPEIWQYVNDLQRIYSYSSSSGYTTFTPYFLGGNRGYLL